MGGAWQASSGIGPDGSKHGRCGRVAVKWHRLFQAYGTNSGGCLMRNRIEQLDATAFGLGRTQLILIFGLVSLGLWIPFAKLAMPPRIASAYHGQSFPFLNGIIEGQSVHPVEFYLHVWNRITTTGLSIVLTFCVLRRLITSKTFSRKFVGEAKPGTLGAIRMWTCAILLMITLWDDLGSLALLPPEYRVDMGLMAIFHAGPL